jgi:hypothetical protein
MAGGLAGTAFWLACYPLDVVKSKLQVGRLSFPGACPAPAPSWALPGTSRPPSGPQHAPCCRLLLSKPPPACPSRHHPQVDSYQSPKYSGIIDCGRKIVAAHGPRGLWKGFGPALARSFPANAACFAVYEASQQWISQSLGL